MKTLSDLHAQHPWKSIKRFMPYALEKGFTESEVKKYFKDYVLKDKLSINQSHYFLPIYGKNSDCYQFDTLIQSKSAKTPAFLIFININSRKAYAYAMNNKGSDEVLRVLKSFIPKVKPKYLTSDQDTAYLSSKVIDFIHQNNINYHTTEDNNHNVLGIINRFMKTLRDLNKERNFTIDGMNSLINEYNNTTHSGTGKKPNEFNAKDEENYIEHMEKLTDSIMTQKGFNLKKGDKVRIVLDKQTLGKKRTNLSTECYIVDSVNGNGYNIKSLDDSVAFYPRHKLVLTKVGKVANTLNDGKRGIIEKIISYNSRTDKYRVQYQGGVKDEIKAKSLRETNPTRLSDLEIQFWKNKEKPNIIKKFS